MIVATEIINGFNISEGVYVSQLNKNKFETFEQTYLAIREKEKRVLSIDEIKQLPFVPNSSSDFGLWKIRRKNIHRFLKFLAKKKSGLNILDIGCGNGFFTHLMANHHHQLIGLDVNLTELKQAATAFPDSNIKWFFADVIEDKLPIQKLDIITFCTSFHYFNNPKQIIEHCLSLLNTGGEIHIIDSPFYNETTKTIAKQNSLKHFQKMGVPAMINHYHHNTYEVLSDFDYKIMYNPYSILNKIPGFNDSPFPWIIIR